MQAVTTKIQFAKRRITLIARLCAISTRHLRVTKRGYVLRHEVSIRRHEIITSNWSSEYYRTTGGGASCSQAKYQPTPSDPLLESFLFILFSLSLPSPPSLIFNTVVIDVRD